MADEIKVLDPSRVILRGSNTDPSLNNGKKVLTDWENEPTLNQLKDDYLASKSFHENQMSKVNEWVNAFNTEGRFKAPAIEGRSKVSPKVVRKQVEWRCPSLTEPFLSNKQLLQVEPRTSEDVKSAEQNSLVLNYQFTTKLNLVKLMDDIVRTMAIEGTAILKPSWNYEENILLGLEDQYEAVIDHSVVEEYNQMMEKLKADPDYAVMLTQADKMGLSEYSRTGQPIRYVVTDRIETEKIKVTANHPDLEVCDIDDVYVDPTCKGKIEKAKFIVHRFDTCLADLKADGRYTNLDEVKNHVKSNAEEATPKTDETGFRFKDDERRQLEAFEYWGYWDTDDTGILNPIVATWVGNTLIQLTRSPFSTNRLPFIFIPLTPVKNSLYGEPDAELLSDNQLIIGATMRGMIDLFGRSANGQSGTAKGFLDASNKTKFNSGENYDFNPELPPDKAIYTHKFPELPRSAFDMLALMNKEAESLSGVQAFNSGVNGDALGKTAVGVRSTLDATAKRDTAILRRIATGITTTAYFFQEMNALFLTEDDFVRLTNDQFVPIDPENLNGDFDLKIDISTAEEDASKVADLSFLLQTGQNSFPFEFTKKILAAIAKLKKLPELAKFIENYEPQPDPFTQKKQELELQKMELENQLIAAQIFETQNKGLVNEKEALVRVNRADKLKSDTNNADLKFFKDAEGINQQEEIERIMAQAKAQIRVKDNDHINSIDMSRFNHNSNLLQLGANTEVDNKFNREPKARLSPLQDKSVS